MDRPLLSIQIIVPGDDIGKMEKVGISKLKEYLNYMAFVTNMTFKIHKLIRIIDWSIGVRERKCIQFERFPGTELPHFLLEEKLFKTIETLQKIEIDTAFKRALKWFSNGINAEYPDDQFQYFWYVVELLAQRYKKAGTVNDLCPKCQNPLFCEKCGEYSTHRPYPKQAIQQLFEIIIRDKPQQFFNITNDIRNALMHGDSIKEIEKKHNIELDKIVDKIGFMAWISILNTFKESFKISSDETKLNFIKTNIYSHKVLTAELYLTMCSDPNNPRLSELVRPEIKLVPLGENNDKT